MRFDLVLQKLNDVQVNQNLMSKDIKAINKILIDKLNNIQKTGSDLLAIKQTAFDAAD